MKAISEILIGNYFDNLKKRKVKARNRLQELVEPYLKFINWQNETLANDLDLFYISASRAYKRITEYEFLQRFEWIKEKNCLHPLQVVKFLNK